jgi:hypothetical protein
MVALPGAADDSTDGCNRNRTDWLALPTNRFLWRGARGSNMAARGRAGREAQIGWVLRLVKTGTGGCGTRF